ncbi:MAG: CBS domain-containing protein [Candidatus Kariarchaeaceae archaeon]
MTNKVITIKKTATFGEGIDLMKRYSISQIPVVHNRTIVGTISESNVLNLLGNYYNLKVLRSELIDGLMDAPLPIVPKNAKTGEITPLLHHYSAIIVLDKGLIAGIVTKADLLD